jgi:hypothetical protein
MQTGRLAAVDIAQGTLNVVYHLHNTTGNTAVVSLNLCNRGTVQADFDVCVSTTDDYDTTGVIASNVLEGSDVFSKSGILLDANERIIVRSLQGNISAVVSGNQSVTTVQAPAASVAYVVPITYALTAAITSVNEGSNASIVLATTGILNGVQIPYTITGTVESADIGGASLTGNMTVNGNVAIANIPLTADETTEGAETLIFTLDAPLTAYTVTITINDTSVPVIVGITGTGGVITESGGYRAHQFNSDGTFSIASE